MPKSSSSNTYCTWENTGVLFHNYLTITLKNQSSQKQSVLIPQSCNSSLMPIKSTASCYTALLLYYPCLNVHTDVSIVLFRSIKPEPLFHHLFSRDEENPTRYSNKKPHTTEASKLNFKVSLFMFLPRRKEAAEISSEIQATKNGTQKNPPQLTLIKEQRCGKRKKSKLKQHLKFIIRTGGLFCQRLIQKDVFVPTVLPLVLCLGLPLSTKTWQYF